MGRVSRVVRWMVAAMVVAASVAGEVSDRSGGEGLAGRNGPEPARGPEWGRGPWPGFQGRSATSEGPRAERVWERPLRTQPRSLAFLGQQESGWMEDLVWLRPVVDHLFTFSPD